MLLMCARYWRGLLRLTFMPHSARKVMVAASKAPLPGRARRVSSSKCISPLRNMFQNVSFIATFSKLVQQWTLRIPRHSQPALPPSPDYVQSQCQPAAHLHPRSTPGAPASSPPTSNQRRRRVLSHRPLFVDPLREQNALRVGHMAYPAHSQG